MPTTIMISRRATPTPSMSYDAIRIAVAFLIGAAALVFVYGTLHVDPELLMQIGMTTL